MSYRDIQEAHYRLAERNVPYRIASLSVLAVFAPVIVAGLWGPYVALAVLKELINIGYETFSVARAYLTELYRFYTYLPRGFKGERRDG